MTTLLLVGARGDRGGGAGGEGDSDPVAHLAGLLVIEYFHCQGNNGAVISAERRTKEMPSCKQHAEAAVLM